MLEPRTGQRFHEDLAHGFVAGESWLYFALNPSLFGYTVWGRPTPDDVRNLVHLLELELQRPPHLALVDFSQLKLVSPEAFESLAVYTMRHAEVLKRIVTRAVIVRPKGVNGAIVTGFFDVASRPFPVSFSQTVEQALIDLGQSDAGGLAADLANARAHVCGEAPLLVALRAQLATDLATPRLGDIARVLGMAARTLQRRLTALQTSFMVELHRARLEAAERYLVETDAPVTNIALDLGFKASQHFATAFKRHTGHTPTDFRSRARSK